MRKDFFIALSAGFVTSLLGILVLYNLHIFRITFLLLIPIIFPPLWGGGIIIAHELRVFLPTIYQFAKFVIVGMLNTAIDFGVLNALSIVTGITAGFIIGGINVPGFFLASINSYFWNKFWVFDAGENHYSDSVFFVLAVSVGLLLNSGIVVFMTTYITSFIDITPSVWLNISKAVATLFSLFWNFFAFKMIVFRKSSHPYA